LGFGLRKEVGCDECGVGGAVGKHEYFGWASGHIDGYTLLANDLFGLGNILIARAEDLIYRRDRLGAESHGCNGLGATHPVHRVHSGDSRRCQQDRRDLAVGISRIATWQRAPRRVVGLS